MGKKTQWALLSVFQNLMNTPIFQVTGCREQDERTAGRPHLFFTLRSQRRESPENIDTTRKESIDPDRHKE